MLGSQIFKLRKQAGLTQARLAKQLHISPSAEGMYEQGRRTPSIDIVISMAQLFGVSLDYLLTGSEYTPPCPAEDCPGTTDC